MVKGGTGRLFRIIRQYYQHSFRELFLNGTGPLQVHRAVLSVLAGNVFPKTPWPMRWRMWLFNLNVWVNRYIQLVPRQEHFSLVNSRLPQSSAVEGPAPVAPNLTSSGA